MASLVRFTVSSELMDGPGGGDPVYEEDGPSFPSLNRPSSNAGSASVISAQDEVSSGFWLAREMDLVTNSAAYFSSGLRGQRPRDGGCLSPLAAKCGDVGCMVQDADGLLAR